MKGKSKIAQQRYLYGGGILLLTALLIFPALSWAQEDLSRKIASGNSFFDKKIDHPALKEFRSHLHWLNPLSYGRVDEALSVFNPFGAAFDPLEEAIPGLMVKGFVRNRSLLKLRGGHGVSNKTRVGRPNDYNKAPFDMIEWLGEFEMHYSPPAWPNVRFVNIWNMRYDSVYDWFGSRINSPAPGDPRAQPGTQFGSKGKALFDRQFEYYNDTEKILRELYVDWFATDALHFRFGKQQLPWGKVNEFKVIDIINPEMSWHTGNTATNGNSEWTRIPLWMVNADYSWGDYMFQVLATWDYEPTEGFPIGMTYGGFGAPGPNAMKVDEPSESFENGEYGAKFNFIKGGWDVSLVYWYSWDDTPTSFSRFVGFDPSTGAALRATERKTTRIHQWGTALDKSFWFAGRNWLYRLESVYSRDLYFTRFGLLGPPFGHSRPGSGDPKDNVSKVDEMQIANILETYLFGDWNLQLIDWHWHRFKYHKSEHDLASLLRKDQNLFLWSINHAFECFDDRLILAYVQYWWPPDTGFRLERQKAIGIYLLTDYLTLNLIADLYGGAGNTGDVAYGGRKEQNVLRMDIAYNF